jgi:hypothetical protein
LQQQLRAGQPGLRTARPIQVVNAGDFEAVLQNRRRRGARCPPGLPRPARSLAGLLSGAVRLCRPCQQTAQIGPAPESAERRTRLARPSIKLAWEEIAMRRLQVIIPGFAILMLVTACAGTAQRAPRHDPATARPQQRALVQDAATGKHQSGRGTPSFGGQQPANRLAVPAWRCSSPPSGAEASDPLPCAPMLLVPVFVVHPRHGQPRIIYVRKPCWCASGG